MLCVSIVVFLIVGYFTVVYALAYTTGSFRVVANVDAAVYINGKRSGSTSFLGNAFSKSNVLPNNYVVELKKDGYMPWKKNITVTAKLFTDFPKITLIPDNFEDEEIFEKFASPSSAPTRKLKGKVAEFDGRNLWVTWLDDTDYQPFHKTGDREIVLRADTPITQIEWFPDNNHIIYLSGGKLWFAEIDTRGGLNTYDLGVGHLSD